MTDDTKRRTLHGLEIGIGFLMALILFAGAFLVIRHEIRDHDLQAEIDAIQANRFTAEDFVHWITNTSEMADSLRQQVRQQLDIPPPEVRQALDRHDALLDSLLRRVEALE